MKSRWEKGKEVYKGNYEGSSSGMERQAMKQGIAKLKAAGLLPLVKGWVCDKDPSVFQLNGNPDTAHIPIHWDPGHIKKNFQKQLRKIYGKNVRYTNMAARGGKQISQDKDCVAVCIDGIDDGLYDRMRATHRGIFSVLLSRMHFQVTGSWQLLSAVRRKCLGLWQRSRSRGENGWLTLCLTIAVAALMAVAVQLHTAHSTAREERSNDT